MGVLPRPLTALLLVLLLPAAARASSSGCLGCHPVHYEARGSCAHCHRGDDRTDRKNVAHRDLIPGAYAWFTQADSPAVRGGMRRIEASFCRRCHGWLGQGNALAANLDDLAAVSSPRKIHESIRNPAAYMPDFRFDEAQTREIVNAILSGGARPDRKERAEIPAVIHFEDPGGNKDLLFPRHCGGCHRILSDSWGGLGAGSVAPNLSGLFTRHYPASFGTGAPWTPENLKKWMRNPRSVKPAATMPPVPLEAEEAEALARFLSSAGARSR